MVILDDMVLDMNRYRWNHPGGNFTIQQNVGKDVSKFFYGGQMLENNLSTTPYAHSNIARLIVNTLIIGKLEKEAPKYKCKITERVSVSPRVQTMILKTGQTIPGLKMFHPDIAEMGKHYMVRCMSLPKVRRNYTISNAMRKHVYDEYVNTCREYVEKGSIDVEQSFLKFEKSA
ncbi:MAG: cytochrome b5 domain-containing protein [Candidatus Roizmanbacteria bacterium]